MTNNFKKAYAVMQNNEGGYVNSAIDKGGETFRGISRVHNPNNSIWAIVDDLKNKGISSASDINNALKYNKEVDTIIGTFYYNSYWLKASCDKLPSELQTLHFDSAVLFGVNGAGKFLQNAINVYLKDTKKLIVDGILGVKSFDALGFCVENDIKNNYIQIRIDLHKKRVEIDPTQKVFLKGWLNRVKGFR